MTQSPLIDVQKLNYHQGTRHLLQDIEFQVLPSRIHTLVGPNGSGKSTLIKLMLGLEPIQQGSIRSRHDLSVGYMPQRVVIDNTLPLRVCDFLSLARGSSSQDRQEALERVGANHLYASPFQGLSGGETQRVLLARALLRKPNLLVLDEPVQGVDVKGQTELYALIEAIKKDMQCAIFMVSHDLHYVMSSTDEVLCLNGHICCQGSPDSVSSHPSYLELFGQKVPDKLAHYTHHHDHSHDH